MNYFTVIIILYIIFYVILTIISASNERKRRERIKEKIEKERIKEKEVHYKEDYKKIYKQEYEEEEEPIRIEETEKITPAKEIFEKRVEFIPEEKTQIEEITISLIEKEKIIHPEYEKVPLKLKKVFSFTKNDILKGIIFKEILTPKFKK